MRTIFYLITIFWGLQTHSVEERKIPAVFHWIHLENGPLSQQEIQSIRSWQAIHPNWICKIWTNAPVKLSKTKICPLQSGGDLENLRREILQREGGVWVHPDLIGCKPLDILTFKEIGFVACDGYSILGCSPGHFEKEKKVLPTSFILPDQVFTTNIAFSPLSGVCFWRFKDFPSLTEELKKVHSSKAQKGLTEHKLSKKLKGVKKLCLPVFVLVLLNTLMGAFLIYQFRKVHLRWVLKYALATCVLGVSVYGAVHVVRSRPAEINIQNFFQQNGVGEWKTLFPGDWQSLENYSRLYASYFEPSVPLSNPLIPRTIHFIWGGESPFPEKSIPNIVSWMKHHPNWKIKFWTDTPSREVPVAGMEKHLFDEVELSEIGFYLEKATNWGERSDLLRYQILYSEGGVYVDHDIECYRCFDGFNDRFSFYACLEPLHLSPLKESHVIVANCLIGAQAGHSILRETLEQVAKNWEILTHIFPCDDRLSALLRTLGRTFDSFNTAVSSQISFTEKAFILPSHWVFPNHLPLSQIASLRAADCLFASHKWDNTWFKDFSEPSPYEVSQRLVYHISSLSKKIFAALVWNLSVFGLFAILSASLWIHKKRKYNVDKTPSYASIMSSN